MTRRTASDKILRDETINTSKIQNTMDIKVGLVSMIYKCFDNKTSGAAIKPNQGLTQELRKPIIRKFVERKVCSYFIDTIWGADLADVQLLSTLRKIAFHYMLLIFIVNLCGLFL